MKADATEKANCDEQLARTEEKKDHLEHDISYQNLQPKLTLDAEMKELQAEQKKTIFNNQKKFLLLKKDHSRNFLRNHYLF